MKSYIFLTLLLAGFLNAQLATAAAPWTVLPCGTAHAKEWQVSAERMRAAKPGSPIYVPRPYPATDAQVIEDFLYQHRDVWSDTPAEKLGAPERRFFSAVDSGDTRFEVFRVTNWTPLLCGPQRQRPFYFVIRVIEASTGIEISRAALDDDGRLARVRHRPANRDLEPMPSQDTARGALARIGVPAQDLQYVTAWGTLDCDLMTPCVASRHGGGAHVVKHGKVYRLQAKGERLSLKRHLGPAQRDEVSRRYETAGSKLVSVGADVFTVALPVEP
jgi:hypothetical protein